MLFSINCQYVACSGQTGELLSLNTKQGQVYYYGAHHLSHQSFFKNVTDSHLLLLSMQKISYPFQYDAKNTIHIAVGYCSAFGAEQYQRS